MRSFLGKWHGNWYELVVEYDEVLMYGQSRRPRRCRIVTNPGLLSACLTASPILNAILGYQAIGSDMDLACSIHTSPSRPPILKDIDIKYTETQFNGSFAKASIHRQKPSPAVDEAWEALGTNYLPVVVAEDDVEQAGLAPGLLKRTPELGGGFLVAVEGLHHLHCLTSHGNYEYYQTLGEGPFENNEEILYTHAGHCLDILRQQLMCAVDFNVLGQVWVEGIGAFPDFMTRHKCKNFDAVRQWAHDHQIHDGDGNANTLELRPGDWKLQSIP